MKKMMCLAAALLLTVFLAACADSDPVATTTQPEQTTLPRQTTLAPESTAAPTEQILGELKVGMLSELNKEDFSEIMRTEVDKDGEQIALYSDGILKDVTMEWGTMDPEGKEFLPEQEFYSAEEMSPETLVAISAYLSDVVPNIRIVYTGREGPSTSYVFQSGEDGSLLLTP